MKKTKALSFKKETIRTLSSQELSAVVGGGGVLADSGIRCQINGGGSGGGCQSETLGCGAINPGINVIRVG